MNKIDEYREHYIADYTKEIENKLNLDKKKIYSIEEINYMLDTYNLRGGAIQFIPESPQTGQKIIDALVHIDTLICDAIHENICYYGNRV